MVFQLVSPAVSSPERQVKGKSDSPSLFRGYSSPTSSSSSSYASLQAVPLDQMVCVKMVEPISSQATINPALRAVFFKRILSYFLHNRTPLFASATYSIVVFNSIREYDLFMQSDNSGLTRQFPNKEAIPLMEMRDDEEHNCSFSIFKGESHSGDNVHPNNGNHWLVLVLPAKNKFKLTDGVNDVHIFRERMLKRLSCIKSHVEEYIAPGTKITCIGVYSYGIEANSDHLPTIDVLLMSEFTSNSADLNDIRPSNGTLALMVFANLEILNNRGNKVVKSWVNDSYSCNEEFNSFVNKYKRALVLHRNFNNAERQKDMSNFELFFDDTFDKVKEPSTCMQEVSHQLLDFYLKYIGFIKIFLAIAYSVEGVHLFPLDVKKGTSDVKKLVAICRTVKEEESIDIENSGDDLSMLSFLVFEWDHNRDGIEHEVLKFSSNHNIAGLDWVKFENELIALRESIINLKISVKRKAQKNDVSPKKKQKTKQVVDLEEDEDDDDDDVIEDEASDDEDMQEEENNESEDDSQNDIGESSDDDSSEFEEED